MTTLEQARQTRERLRDMIRVGDEFSNKNETTFAAVLVDMHDPNFYRVQVYDHKGLVGHYLESDIKGVVNCLLDFLGYGLKPAPGSMDEIVGGLRKENPGPEQTFLFPGDVLEVVESFTQRVYFPPSITLTRIIYPEEEDWIEYQGLLRGTRFYHFVFMPRDEDGTVMEHIHFAVKRVESVLRYCTLV